MVLSPRQLELAQPKVKRDPSTNDPVNNANQDSRKPMWRSSRELFMKGGGNRAPGPGTGYHEDRFGWRSGYFIMWDTHPTGTRDDTRLARPEILAKAAYHKVRERPHDDPTAIRLLPTAHTTSACLASPHTAWDARQSRAWQETCNNERRSMTAPRTGTKSYMSPRTAHASHLRKMATPHRPTAPFSRPATVSVAGGRAFVSASSPQHRFGPYRQRAVH